jgi:hypothetical protein
MALRYARAMTAMRRPAGDRELVQIVDAALGDAGRRAGDWLACRPGCTQCCVGVFAINSLDAARLLDGLAILRKLDPARAERIVARAREAVARLSADFPGAQDTTAWTDDYCLVCGEGGTLDFVSNSRRIWLHS